MEDIYCAFCEMDSDFMIKESKTPICSACKKVYLAGQASPNATLERLPDDDEVREAFFSCQKVFPDLTLDDLEDPSDLRKRANEYTREGEYYETVEPDEEEARKKYYIAEKLEKLAKTIEENV